MRAPRRSGGRASGRSGELRVPRLLNPNQGFWETGCGRARSPPGSRAIAAIRQRSGVRCPGPVKKTAGKRNAHTFTRGCPPGPDRPTTNRPVSGRSRRRPWVTRARRERRARPARGRARGDSRNGPAPGAGEGSEGHRRRGTGEKGHKLSHQGVAGVLRGRGGRRLRSRRGIEAGPKSLEKMVQNRTKKFGPGHIRQPRPELQRAPRPPHAEAIRWVSTLNANHRTSDGARIDVDQRT